MWIYFLFAVSLLPICSAVDRPNRLMNATAGEVNEPGGDHEDLNVKTKSARLKDPLVIQTKSGLVRGFRKVVLGKEIDVFYGIPFAKPPVDDLRFKKPVPIDPWHNILEANTLPNSCVQQPYEYFPGFRGEEMWNPNTPLSEDCLYLNIWAPASLRGSKSSSLTSVLVWIYGGGYMGGTTTLDIYDADIMAAANDIVVTSMQYRVGAFGFLYLGIEDAPGNMGMYDQALAIKWIRDNALYFGGDPSQITLFGESAGASSVSVHLLSPVSRHLFDRAILQSGVVNAPWSIMSADQALDIGRRLVDDCGCNASSLQFYRDEVMDCLRSVDSSTISVQQWNSYSGILRFPSTPIVDGEFLPDDPVKMLQRGDFKDCEILIGSNRDEGTFFIVYDFAQYFEKDDASYLERDKFLEIINEIFKDWTPMEREAIIFQYTDWDHINNGYLNQKLIGDVVGDYYFVCPNNYFAQMFAEHGRKVYYYFFTHRTSINPWGIWMGVMHADEIDYVFGHPLNESNGYSDAEIQLSRRMMGYYTRFADSGRPVEEHVNWPIYSRNQPQYFEWSAVKRGLGKGPRATGCAFWNELMPLLREKHGTVCESEMQKAVNSSTNQSSGLLITFAFVLFTMMTSSFHTGLWREL